MRKLHDSGLFIYNGNRVILNRLPKDVKSYSIANSDGEIIISQPANSKYNFYVDGNILVVNLNNGTKRMFRLNSKGCFEEIAFIHQFVKESDLEGEDVLLYHLGLLDKKYSKNN